MWQICVFSVEGCGVSSAEYRVHLVVCREFCVVHSWQNGTRCRDGVNVLWCRSHLVWLVFEGPIPTCTCFHSENFFVSFPVVFLLIVSFRNSKREDRWERKARGRCMVCKV